MDKWQYTTAQFITRGLGNDDAVGDLEKALNELGGQGWELVTTTIYRNAEAGADVLLCVFTRPAPATPTALRALAAPHVPTETETLQHDPPRGPDVRGDLHATHETVAVDAGGPG